MANAMDDVTLVIATSIFVYKIHHRTIATIATTIPACKNTPLPATVSQYKRLLIIPVTDIILRGVAGKIRIICGNSPEHPSTY